MADITPNDIFTRAWKETSLMIDYQKKWSNGSGYHDFAVYGENAPRIKNGELVKAQSPGNRRIIIIGTRLGNVAVFDRFKDQTGDPKAVFVHNSTSAFDVGCWVESGPELTTYDMEILFGAKTIETNIGWRIEQLFSTMKKGEKVAAPQPA